MGRIRAAAGVATVLYLLAWFAFAQDVGASGDAAAIWGAPQGLRSVLCVAPGPRLTLAAAPTEADRAAVHATLLTTEERRGPPGLQVVHRDEGYRASLAIGGHELPWMKNEYTGGFSEWPSLAAFRTIPSASFGRAPVMLLGALVVAWIAWLAGRIAGWPAALLAGSLLAVDPAFHLWKKILAGPEVALQVCAVAALALLLRARRERSRRALLLAALVCGLGLHAKPTFAAAALPLALGTVPLLPWGAWRRGRLGLLLGVALLGLLGAAPSLLYQASDPPPSWGRQEQAVGRAQAVLRRLRRPQDGGAGRSSEARKGPKKAISAPRALLTPGSWFATYWGLRAAHDNDPATRDPARPDRSPPWVRLGALATALLAVLAMIGGLRRGGEVLWVVGLALWVPACVHLLHPDPHHLGLALPFLALGIGVGATSAWPRGGWLVAALALVAVLGRAADLGRMDGELDERAGRTLQTSTWAAIGAALLEEGATSPAALDYEAMALSELHTRGRVRPFLYARAQGPREAGCLEHGSDRWLAAVLRAHGGGHLLTSWGPDRSPDAGMRSSWVDPVRLRSIAAAQGQGIRAVRDVRDRRGRWAATIYAITDAPPPPGSRPGGSPSHRPTPRLPAP